MGRRRLGTCQEREGSELKSAKHENCKQSWTGKMESSPSASDNKHTLQTWADLLLISSLLRQVVAAASCDGSAAIRLVFFLMHDVRAATVLLSATLSRGIRVCVKSLITSSLPCKQGSRERSQHDEGERKEETIEAGFSCCCWRQREHQRRLPRARW